MRWLILCRLVLAAAGLAASLPLPAAGLQTVCTITVNSADEKAAFQRHLPASKYRFVELVERGRPDWLASACRAGISCDVLVISGHYDGGNEFFSDQLEVREFLPVDEMERVSCSGACAGLFSRLKEVHLFGCNTLNPAPQSSASEEIVRSLVREGVSLPLAQYHWKRLVEVHGESSRERMRQIFKDVPAIYGFSSVAPLGPVAGATLGSYFRQHGTSGIGQGRPNSQLLAQFAPFAMTVARGMDDRDPRAAVRHDMCQFVDDRLSDAQRLAFVHQLLQRRTPDARMVLDRIQRFATALGDPARRTPEVMQVLAQIAGDAAARGRFLDLARDSDRPETRVRMLKVARDLGWVSADEQWHELALMLGELQARRDIGLTEVNLACSLNRDHQLDGAFNRRVPPGPADDVGHAAVRACLGSSEAHARTLQGLTGSNVSEVQIARAYLRHRPITDPAELRDVAARIAGMAASEAQVLALEALGRHHVSDRALIELLTDLYVRTRSWSVQAAIAGILIRADRQSLDIPPLERSLRAHRLPSPAGEHMIDALLRRLQPP